MAFVLFFSLLFGMQSIVCEENNRISLNLITTFLKQHYISSTVLITCWPASDQLKIMKELSSVGIRVQASSDLLKGDYSMSDTDIQLRTHRERLGIILDYTCPNAEEFIKQTSLSEHQHFSFLYFWLFFGPGDLKYINVTLESKALYAEYNKDSRQFEICWLFRYGFNLPDLIRTNCIGWQPGMRIPISPSHNDLNGVIIETGIPVVEDDWANFNVYSRRHLNVISKMSFDCILHLQDTLNFTISEQYTSDWGYHSTNGYYNGLIGMFQNKTVDLGSSLLFAEYRLQYIDYTLPYVRFSPRFIFRQPPISATKNIYLLTFSYGVWISFVCITFFTAIGLKLTQRDSEDKQHTWVDHFFTALAIICQQGSEKPPKRVSPRIVFFSLLLLAVIFDNSYSASIVVLLQSPNTFIRTLKDLVESPFKLGMQNLEYNTHYINLTQNPIVHRLYREKIFNQPPESTYLDLPEGIAKMRKGLFAFLVDLSSNKVILDTFEEHEKCGLQEIYMAEPRQISITLRRNNTLQEIVKQKMLILLETGFIYRIVHYWYKIPLVCFSNEQSFVSVSLQDFHPALQLVSFGICSSTFILICEIIYYRLSHSAKCCKFCRIVK